MTHSGACTRDWQGTRKSHCASCCENFSTPANFDKHRRGGACVPPAEAGLALNKRGVWVTPGETDFDERFGRG